MARAAVGPAERASVWCKASQLRRQSSRAAAFMRMRHAAIAPHVPLEIIEGRASDVLLAADAALVVSGTISLESALCGTPAVVAYRLAALSYWWLRRALL